MLEELFKGLDVGLLSLFVSKLKAGDLADVIMKSGCADRDMITLPLPDVQEKAPYISEAADRKAKYETAMATYKNGSTEVCIGWPFRLSVDKFYYCCISSMLACQDCFIGFSTIVGTSDRHMCEDK
jgi:hypothetical protein